MIINELLVNRILSELGISPPLVDVIFNHNICFLVFHFVPHAELKHILKRYSPREKFQYLLSLFSVLKKFHKTGLVHLDIKPDNFLYCSKLKRAYLIDFGMCDIDDFQIFLSLKLISTEMKDYVTQYYQFKMTNLKKSANIQGRLFVFSSQQMYHSII